MQFSTVDYKVENGVAWMTLNRPDNMNAINLTMSEEIAEVMTLAGEDDAVRALVVTGAGERAFCAGLDLNARGDESPMDPDKVLKRTIHPERSLHGALLGFEKPYIAAVNGVAVGGGLEIVLAADIIIAAEAARFGTAHVKLGLPLLDTLGYLLPRRVSIGLASDMAFTGRLVGAEEALRAGLADRVVPNAELVGQAGALAEEIAGNAPLSLHFSKQAIRRAYGETYQDYMRFERYFFGVVFSSDDAKEAIRARRQQRKPVFKGR